MVFADSSRNLCLSAKVVCTNCTRGVWTMALHRGIWGVSSLCLRCMKPARPQVVLRRMRVSLWGATSQHPIFTTSPLWDDKTQKKAPEGLDIEENPYFMKYKEKIKTLQKSSPEEYRERVDKLKEMIRQDQEWLKEQMQKAEEEAKKKKESASMGWPPKSLDEVMKLDLVQDKTAEEISQIWTEHHSKKDGVYGVLQSYKYDSLTNKAVQCPLFVYPLPRQDGFEFFLSQFEGKSVFFTPLVMFQRYKENASPCMTVVHFTELLEDKGIVLMAGKYDDKLLTRKDALNLVRQMSVFYGKGAVESFNLVRIFNRMPEKFSYVDLIEEYKEMEKFLNAD